MSTPRSSSAARLESASRSSRRLVMLVALALLTGVSAGSARSRPARDFYEFGGRLIPADNGSLQGVHVVATDARGSYEALLDSSGVFVGAFPEPPSGRVTLRVFSDSADPRYHTSIVTLGGAHRTLARVVLVPVRWRIRGGAFDGRDVSIDPVRAAANSSEASGFWRVTKRGQFAGRAVSWVVDSFPVRVAFRHERGDPTISAPDSVAFWEIAGQVERLIGRSLFRPTSFAEIDSGADGILVTVNRGMSAAGRTFITYDPTGRIYEALVTVADRRLLAEPRIAAHELLHAIGLGHTRSWTSVMAPSTGANNVPSVDDVAYAQLYYAISELQRQREAPFGILEAIVR